MRDGSAGAGVPALIGQHARRPDRDRRRRSRRAASLVAARRGRLRRWTTNGAASQSTRRREKIARNKGTGLTETRASFRA